jgi:hypothetical protein
VSRQQAQLVRLLLMCAAWAVGQIITIGLSVSVPGADLLVPAVLAAGVYVVTEDLGRPRLDRDNAKYWRGRPIDDDRPRRDRWN